MAPPPTPSGGFGGLLRNLPSGEGRRRSGLARAPLLLSPQRPSSPPEVAASSLVGGVCGGRSSSPLSSAFSEPLPSKASPSRPQQQQQQRRSSRSPRGGSQGCLEGSPPAEGQRKEGSRGGGSGGTTTTGFSLSPNGAAAPLALEMTSAATTVRRTATAAAAEAERRERKGPRGRRERRHRPRGAADEVGQRAPRCGGAGDSGRPLPPCLGAPLLGEAPAGGARRPRGRGASLHDAGVRRGRGRKGREAELPSPSEPPASPAEEAAPDKGSRRRRPLSLFSLLPLLR